jgi:hypothetical protein
MFTKEAKKYLLEFAKLTPEDIEDLQNKRILSSVYEDTPENFYKHMAKSMETTPEHVKKHITKYLIDNPKNYYKVVRLSNGNYLEMFLDFSENKEA